VNGQAISGAVTRIEPGRWVELRNQQIGPHRRRRGALSDACSRGCAGGLQPPVTAWGGEWPCWGLPCSPQPGWVIHAPGQPP
jgi:hypothetical protein